MYYLESISVFLLFRECSCTSYRLHSDCHFHARHMNVSDTGKHTFQCNPIQNHTVYSPKGNSICKALTLSNIYKHWADAISFLSFFLSLFILPLVFLSQAFRSHVSNVEWSGPCRKSVLVSIAL